MTTIANDPMEVKVTSFDHPRRSRRFRPETLGPEILENREVMANSAMGFSLPQVVVGNYVSPLASWGQDYTVQLQAFNRGASSQAEPLAQFPYATSMADANTTVDVYLVAGHGPRQRQALLETIDLGTITQNSAYGAGANAQFTVKLPDSPPAGFPAAGGKFRILVVPTVANQVRLPSSFRNSGASYSVPVKIMPSLPQIQFLGSNVPRNLVPGQVILPEIQVANIGAANVNTQGPLKVIMVASADRNYNPGDVTLAEFTINDLSALNERPLDGGIDNLPAGTVSNLNLAANQAIATGAKLTFPLNSTYYIGFVIDPDRTLTQLSDQAGVPRSSRLLGLQQVTPRHGFAAPQNLTNTAADLFPNLPYSATDSTVVTPNTQQVAPLVYYPPNMAVGGIKTKPRGWQ
jgi:hypothetical protein